MEPVVGIVLSPPSAQSTAHQTIPTPSRAEHGPGRRFILMAPTEKDLTDFTLACTWISGKGGRP